MSSKCGKVCAMYGCNNYQNQKERKSFFRMPREKERLKKWIIATKRKDLDDLLKVKEPLYFNVTYKVCSDHFDIECFRNKNLLSQGLHPWSVPTLNLYNVVNVKKRKNFDSTYISNTTSEKKMKYILEANEKVICDPEVSEKVINDLEEFNEVFISNNQETRVSISSLQEEISNLKFQLSQYKRKLNNKIALLSKYRKQNVLLKQKLFQLKNIKESSDK